MAEQDDAPERDIPECLHCHVADQIRVWAARYSDPETETEEEFGVDLDVVIVNLTGVMADFLAEIPDEADRNSLTLGVFANLPHMIEAALAKHRADPEDSDDDVAVPPASSVN